MSARGLEWEEMGDGGLDACFYVWQEFVEFCAPGGGGHGDVRIWDNRSDQ